MRVLQLIDSLEPGGTERMAVNFANALAARVEGSYLCTTRKEGGLKEAVSPDVNYYYLGKTSALDLMAFRDLHRYIKTEHITVLHAHASSFFIGTIMKLLNPALVLIWHDHYGNSVYLDKRPKMVLKWCSRFFDHVFCVNTALKDWSVSHLKTSSVSYLPNFTVLQNSIPFTQLHGTVGKRLVCLANLRPQKDHFTLVKAFSKVLKGHPDWSLHLVGKDLEDVYSLEIKQYIQEKALGSHVFFYGSCMDTFHVLNQSTIGVLSSKSEGLPLALLEYGLAGLPVVATDVGDCNQVIAASELGILVPPKKPSMFAEALLQYIKDESLRQQTGLRLQQHVQTHFSEATAVNSLMQTYKSLVS